jgi:hypothetical protein
LSLTVIMVLLSAVPTEAERLFEEGRVAFKAGDLAKACPTFDKSYALEPTLGSLLNLATCFEKQGRVASSWIRFNDAVAWAQRTHEGDREQFARKHAQDLKPRVSWGGPDGCRGTGGHDRRPAGAGRRVAIAVPVDPGTHELAVAKAGYEPFRATVHVGSAATVQHAIPALVARAGDAPVATTLSDIEPVPWVAPPPPLPVAGVQAEPAAVARQARPERASSSTAGATLLVAGGVVGLAGGAGLAWSFVTYEQLQKQRLSRAAVYRPTSYISREDFDLLQGLYPASWAAVGVGVAAVGVGTVLLATGSKIAIAPVVQPGGASVSVAGHF